MTFISFDHEDYKPQFSGHETFPLRHGWLEKAFAAVSTGEGKEQRSVFLEDSAIAEFGVGKNMVSAIKYWAQVANIISVDGRETQPSRFGEVLLGENGLDPFLENLSSIWMLHWQIASNAKHTSAHWLFNYLAETSFTKDTVIQGILNVVEKNSWSVPTAKTIGNDVSVLLGNYTSTSNSKRGPKEENLTSPLSELGLIRERGNGQFSLNWGQKPSLSDGVFLTALCDFWNKFSEANTLNLQTILLNPGSPGRIFLLEENELAYRLMDIERMSGGLISWSETAGLKQLMRQKKFSAETLERFWAQDYQNQFS